MIRPAHHSSSVARTARPPAHQLQVVRAAAPATLNYPPQQQQQQQQAFPQPQSVAGFYDNPPAGGASRVFANFSLYKGKAAAQLSVSMHDGAACSSVEVLLGMLQRYHQADALQSR